jgi:TrmH family RNA methyltransferase
VELRRRLSLPGAVRLEGLHAVKHALRFGADGLSAVTRDRTAAAALVARIAPDLAGWFDEHVVEVGERLTTLSDRHVPTGVIGVADRPDAAGSLAALRRDMASPIVALEGPRHPGNVGAAVRVAAAAGAAGVIVTGTLDPWHPAAVSGAAGLQFALPVVSMADAAALPRLGRPIVVLDPAGDALSPTAIPADAVLVFGTERHGVSESMLAVARRRVALPMRPGVSSLNLATSVAAVLYLLDAAQRRTASR